MDGDEEPPPDRAFWLLSDETRLDILRAVWEAETPIVFSEIRARLDDPDSGRINYHLGKLTDHYLRKADGGYTLTQAGRDVLRAVYAGSITARPRLPPESIEGSCVDCGGTLTVEYDGFGSVSCQACGRTVMWNEFPPAGLDGRDTEAFAEAFDHWTRYRFRLAMEGLCPNCASEVAVTLPDEDSDGSEPVVTNSCPNCRYDARVPLFAYAVYHPAAVSLFYEEGIDVTALSFWELRRLARDFVVEIDATAPWTAVIRIETDAGSLRFVVDASLDVAVTE